MLYAHASLTDLLHLGTSTTASAVGEVERLGPATVEKIRDWLGRSEDVSSDPSSTSTGAPPWTGTTRPRRSASSSSSATATASSPGAPSTPARTDLDHIDPYVPMDEGGPPGQTNPHNLACLCRRHHRCKTSGRWRYRRRPDGTYEWHGPHGRSYLVTPLGTLEIPTN